MYQFDGYNCFLLQEELQGLGKLLVLYYVTTIAEQLQLRHLNNEEQSGIHLSQLNMLDHILEETHPVKMRGEKTKWSKVPTVCSQNHNTWPGKLLLLKVDLEVIGTD